MVISGNFNTTSKEIKIVESLLIQAGIEYEYVKKSINQDDEDILVKLQNEIVVNTIEVKEESLARIKKYNDLGIDYLSAFYFINPRDEYIWKGAPKKPHQIDEFESKINIVKPGKIYYSKAAIWLFYATNGDEIFFADWFLGKDMTSDAFIEYLRNNCLFAVNNKPATQLSHRDNHQSATFFINRDDPILMQLKQSIYSIFDYENN